MSQWKYFNQTSHKKTKQKQKTIKPEESFVELDEKYKKNSGISKYIW